MFDMGFFELLVVFVIALLVLGPERLPKVVRQVGYWTGRARSTFNNLRYELEREAHNQEMQEKFRKQIAELGLDEKTLSGGTQNPPAKEADHTTITQDETDNAEIENSIAPPDALSSDNSSDVEPAKRHD